MKVALWFSAFACMLVACQKPPSTETQGEQLSGFAYIPLDPMAIKTYPGDSCLEPSSPAGASSPDVGYAPLLESLPDNAVRVSIQTVHANGNVTYGLGKATSDVASHIVTVDYINADTTIFNLWIKKEMYLDKTKADAGATTTREAVSLSYINNGQHMRGSEIYTVSRIKPENSEGFYEYNIPVYVGVGLRVTVNIDEVKGNANISGLGAIGAEAEANRIKGTLVAQTLGINGKSVAAALPIQSELNRTTTQNAVAAVGAIKALLHEKETLTFPRVVGLYLPFPGGKPLVNAIISEMSRDRVPWMRPCKIKNSNTVIENALARAAGGVRSASETALGKRR